ncbi:MAG: DUF4340 domain-containing protein [Candidatus Komeilibacteria bacterium]
MDLLDHIFAERKQVEMLSKIDKKKNVVKTNIILGAVLVVLIIVVSIVMLFVNLSGSDKSLSGLDKKVDSIEITNSEETNILLLQSGQWVLGNYNNQPVKQENVIDIFSTLNTLEIGNIVSSNPDKQSVYQVDDSGIKVVMKNGDKVVEEFVVGKNGPSWPSSYIRFSGNNDVYLVRQMLPQIFGLKEWRELTIAQINSGLIKGLKWSNGLEVVKEDTGWKVVNPEEFVVDETKLKSVLDNLSNLEAIDIADIRAWDLNGQDADFILEVVTDGVNYKIAYYRHDREEGDYDYYTVKEGDDNVYVLTKYIAENMNKEVKFLKD